MGTVYGSGRQFQRRLREGPGRVGEPIAVLSQIPMEKQNKIKNPRQTVFAVKAKCLTRDEYGGKWMF